MARKSDSDIETAISEIIQRDQSSPRTPGNLHLSELAKLRSAYLEKLGTELNEAGLGLERLQKRYDEFRKEADSLYGKLAAPDDRKPVELTESDQASIANRKQVYELIGGRPLVTFPIVIDAPTAIYSIPSGSLLDSNIASWNSWAKWRHNDKRDGSAFLFYDWEYAYIRFLFAWRNTSSEPAVVKRARADLTVRGQLQAIAHPPFIGGVNTDVQLYANHRVHVGSSTLARDNHYITGTVAFTEGWLMGGIGDFETVDFNRVKPVIFEDIIVPPHQFAIFDVGLEATYKIQIGEVNYIFTGPGRYLACPSLAIELSLVVKA